jgi:hypothetical protein
MMRNAIRGAAIRLSAMEVAELMSIFIMRIQLQVRAEPLAMDLPLGMAVAPLAADAMTKVAMVDVGVKEAEKEC